MVTTGRMTIGAWGARFARAGLVAAIAAAAGLASGAAVEARASQSGSGSAAGTGAEAQAVCAFSPLAANVLRAVSAPYVIDGVPVAPGTDERALEAARASSDAALVELVALHDRIVKLRAAHEQLLDELARTNERAMNRFTMDAVLRVLDAIEKRDDAPPLEIVGDAYSRQSEVLPAWRQELAARYAGRSLANLFTERLRAYAAKQTKPGSGAGTLTPFTVGLVLEGPGRGRAWVQNQTGRALPGALVVVRSMPDTKRASAVRVVEDFGYLPVLFGASPDSVDDRKQVNAQYARFLATPSSTIVYVPEWPAGKRLELAPWESEQVVALATSCDVTVWAAGCAPVSKEVKGLPALQAALAAPPPEPPAALFAKAKQLATRDPGGALERLALLRKRKDLDAAFVKECDALHDSIVEALREDLRKRRKESEDADVLRKELNSRLADDPKNPSLQAQHERAKQRCEELQAEMSRLRLLIEKR
ncbi:MAG: hypothetical protein IPJ77_17415 [Planctomycetes bacterium]|nr:hypothetical protein [Planctomycetota bacterium]